MEKDERIQKKEIIQMSCLLLPFIAINFLDIYTTRFALTQCIGLYEINFLYFNSCFETIKDLMPLFVFMLYLLICCICPFAIVRRTCVYSFFGLVMFSFGVVINNILWIHKSIGCYPFG